ncbi:hypothetical protein GCM10009118_25610 [Wandonia haliotis]|uniref:Uncharacterized protein n=1 Tax=Wandonia haliotis TaxID=574963 RepID=A0ABN1MT76_9FLAO
MNYRYALSLVITCLLLLSCKKGDNTPVDLAFEYFPLQEGHYTVYDVLEVRHDAQATIQHDTNRYQLKVVIGDTLLDLQNEIAREYFRYTRPDATTSWALSDVWTAKISGNRAELVEENQRVIKLVFAPTEDKNWDANAFNTYDELDCYYTNLHSPASLSGYQFSSTIKVEQEDFFSLIDHRRKHETYAKGVGLIQKFYKHHEIMNFDTLDVRKGNEIHMKLIEYGEE